MGADLATNGDINTLRAEMTGDIATVRGDIELLRRAMTISLGGMMVVSFGALAVIIRLVPPHL